MTRCQHVYALGYGHIAYILRHRIICICLKYFQRMEYDNITAGYSVDLEKLLTRFEATKSYRLTGWYTIFVLGINVVSLVFAKHWKELEFWRVLDGRRLWHVRATFIEHINQLTVEYLGKDVS